MVFGRFWSLSLAQRVTCGQPGLFVTEPAAGDDIVV
jgi:hypothetical protein